MHDGTNLLHCYGHDTVVISSRQYHGGGPSHKGWRRRGYVQCQGMHAALQR